MEFTYQANDGMFYRVISDGNMVKVKSFRGSDYIFDEKCYSDLYIIPITNSL